MRRLSWIGILSFAFVAGIGMLAGGAHAGTIIKLNLGGDNSTDIGYDGTILSTVIDGDAASPGNQDTGVDYLDILGFLPDIASPGASFSLNGLTKFGPPTLAAGLVIQNFTGGTYALYGPAPLYRPLLLGTLSNSALAGPLGAPATGALFTTSFASVTGGDYAGGVDPNNLTLSMSLGNISNGTGLAAPNGSLLPFFADATLNIADTGSGIIEGGGPEPSTVVLALIGGVMAGVWARRHRS
jgi:PEP-CTERM motif